MTIGFLFMSPSVVGAGGGFHPPEDFQDLSDVPTDDDRRRLRAAVEEVAALPGVLEPLGRSGDAGDTAGVLVAEAIPDESVSRIVGVAESHRLCLIRYDMGGEEGISEAIEPVGGEVLVNATGDRTDCRMQDSGGHVVCHVDRESVTDTLLRDIAWQADRGGRPSVSVRPVDPVLSPVPGVDLVEAFRQPDGAWTVEHRTGDRILELQVPPGAVEESVEGIVEGIVEVVGMFLDGEGDAFLDLGWVDAGIGAGTGTGTGSGTGAGDQVTPQPVTFHFFRAEDFDDRPGEFRSSRDFAAASEEFNDYAASGSAAGDPTPQVLTGFADWMNRRAVQAAEDPANPPSDLYMDLDPYPVRPRGGMLTVTVPLTASIHDDAFTDLLLRAANLGVCMLESSGRVWVNASEGTGVHRTGLRGGGLITTATPEALRSTLESAVIAGTEGFVISLDAQGQGQGQGQGRRGADGGTLVEDVSEVQVGIGNRRWVVHRIGAGGRFSLVNPGFTVDDIVNLLGRFTAGDTTVISGLEWEDISEGTVPDEATRWQLADSLGNVVNVGESEVHVAVPMNYGSDLDWFQVADQFHQGDYITADRHLGTRWSVMWGHGFGDDTYWRRIVDTREDAESLIHAWIDEPEEVFLARGWELVDND